MTNGEGLSPGVRRLAAAVARELAAAGPDEVPQLPPVTREDLEDAEASALRWACITALEHGDPIDEASVIAGADASILNPALRARVTPELVAEFCAQVADPERKPPARWCKPIGALSWDPPDESRRWLLEDLVLRGEPQVMAGPPKSNKTWLGLAIGVAVAAGRSCGPWRNTAAVPARVLVISLEDAEQEARTRISQLLLGAWPAAMERFEVERLLAEHLAISTLGIRLPGSASLDACVKECREWKPELIVIDNLTRIYDGNPNSAQDAAAFGNRWADLSRELHAAILLLHHTAKSTPGEARDPFERIRGSGDLLAVPRHACVVERIGETDVLDVRLRGNRRIGRDRVALELVHQPDQHLDGWLATSLADRGDPEAIKESVGMEKEHRKRKAAQEKRRQEEQVEWHARVAAVDALLELGSHVTSTALGLKLAVHKATAARHLARMAEVGLLVRDGNAGYKRNDA